MSRLDIVENFGGSVRNLRHRMGISQETLAERANLHRTYIAGIEGGARNVTLRVVEKLARALEVSAATLFSPVSESSLRGGKPRPESSVRGLVDVLLAEDNPDDVQMTLEAFKEARFANLVQVAGDGQEALDYVFCLGRYAGRRIEDRPKLLLLDLNLPKVSGLEVLRRLKADRRTQTMRVVVLTASKRERDIAECRRLGAESYIVKPVDFQGLSQATPRLNLDWALLTPADVTFRGTRAGAFAGGGCDPPPPA